MNHHMSKMQPEIEKTKPYMSKTHLEIEKTNPQIGKMNNAYAKTNNDLQKMQLHNGKINIAIGKTDIQVEITGSEAGFNNCLFRYSYYANEKIKTQISKTRFSYEKTDISLFQYKY